MTATVLVATSVHWPDDTRIRERLIRTLDREFNVVYAAQVPGPSDRAGLVWVPLAGRRLARAWRALWIGLTRRWDVMVVHDPDLVPGAMLTRLIRRRPVVFDLHEDLPATVHTRSTVPKCLRRPLAFMLARLLKLTERLLTVTLAEPAYQDLFARQHPCFPNYPDTSAYPDPGGDGSGPAIYLGDVTSQRGVDVALLACSQIDVPLMLMGRVAGEFREELTGMSGLGDGLMIEGPVPNREAVTRLATGSVGLSPLRDLPNYRHSQPTKVLEYLAAGLPVVASDLPGTRQLVTGLEAVLLVPPGDVPALAGAIVAARSPEVLRQAIEQAPLVRRQFGWPGDAVLEFYRSLL
ncbi:MAG: glycosyltransferase [Acidimicrobiia bacterium]